MLQKKNTLSLSTKGLPHPIRITVKNANLITVERNDAILAITSLTLLLLLLIIIWRIYNVIQNVMLISQLLILV